MTRLAHRSAFPTLAILLIARAALAQAPSLGDFVLFGDQGVKARGLVVESGDVGTNKALEATRRIDAPTSRLVAQSVDLDKATTCKALLANSGAATPKCGPRTPVTQPVITNLASACGFPTDLPASCSGQAIVVRHNEPAQRDAGTYSKIDVAGGGAGPGSLVLTGGTYTICGDLTLRRNAQLIVRAPTVLRVLGRIKLDNGSSVAPESLSVSPCQIQIFAKGDRVRVSRRASVQATLCAPNAKLDVTAGAKLRGAFYAHEVKTDRVTLDQACGGPSTTQPPTTTTATTTSSTSSTGAGTSSTSTSSTTVKTTSTTSPCGNSVVDPGEECDPPGSVGGAFCPEGSGCTQDCHCTISTTTTSGAPTTSSTSTSSSTSSSSSSSTEIQTTTTSSTTPTTAPCGNSVVDPGEECDPPGSVGGAFCPEGSGCTQDCHCTISTTTTSTQEASTSSTSSSTAPTTSSVAPSTTIPTTTSTSGPIPTTTSSSTSLQPTTSTSSSSTLQPTTTSSSTQPTTTSTSTSSSTTSSSSSTSTSSTTSTTGGPSTTVIPTKFDFLSIAGTGTCGNSFRDVAGTIPLKKLLCGSLSLGGGFSQVPDNATPPGATNRFTLSGCVAGVCNIGPVASGSTPVGVDCTDLGCRFGTPLPISNAGLSVCVTNTFGSTVHNVAPSGTLNLTTGAASWDFELNSATVLTGNPAQPCPICATAVGGGACSGSPASPCIGVCDGSPNQGVACTSLNPNGLSNDCPAPAATTGVQKCFRGTNNGATCSTGGDCPGGLCSQFIGNIPISLNPLTTGTSTLSDAGGLFCPSQTATQRGGFNSPICQTGANSGKPCINGTPTVQPDVANCGAGNNCRPGNLVNFCNGGANDGLGCSSAATCPAPGVCVRAGTLTQLISEVGTPAGALALNVAKPIKLGSAFCVQATTNPTVNSNANLPGPGGTSVTGTITLLP